MSRVKNALDLGSPGRRETGSEQTRAVPPLVRMFCKYVEVVESTEQLVDPPIPLAGEAPTVAAAAADPDECLDLLCNILLLVAQLIDLLLHLQRVVEPQRSICLDLLLLPHQLLQLLSNLMSNCC